MCGVIMSGEGLSRSVGIRKECQYVPFQFPVDCELQKLED
jgi:hypothetical protein